MANELDSLGLQSLLAAQTQALQNIATRPQKNYIKTTSTPYALEDLLATRAQIGQSRLALDEALKTREGFAYNLANALSNMPQQQGYGSWLGDFARAFGGGMAAPTNAKIDRAQKAYETEAKDLATILALDKAMGDVQEQEIDYKQMPYTGGGKKEEGPVEQPRNFDISPAEVPEESKKWGEREIQAVGRIDPATGARTPLGIAFSEFANKYNPEGKQAYRDNVDAYTKRFTMDRISQITKAAGGSRGIDTMPEVNLKGGPELAAMNLNSKEFEKTVQQQAWSAADQIVKANPNAKITRLELANAFINDFNHGIMPENRIVKQMTEEPGKSTGKSVKSRYIDKTISLRPEDIAKKFNATLVE